MKRKRTLSKPSSFLKKVFDMLKNDEIQEIVSWNKDGQAFTIKNSEEFSRVILPLYFKHKNFSSFTRQLNMYDFHKYKIEENTHTFKHPLFIQGRKDLIKEIMRKSNFSQNSESSANEPHKTELTPLLQKMHELYTDNQNSEQHIKTLEEKIENIRELNSDLLTQLKESKVRIRNFKKMLLSTSNMMGTTEDDLDSLLKLETPSSEDHRESPASNMAIDPGVKRDSKSVGSSESGEERNLNKSDDDTSIYLQTDT